jgi:RHS repeat-associated protein
MRFVYNESISLLACRLVILLVYIVVLLIWFLPSDTKASGTASLLKRGPYLLWQYVAGYFESNTGLVKFGTRYYNPSLGRWTQQDPVAGSPGSSDSLKHYLYEKDDPINVADCLIDLQRHGNGLRGAAGGGKGYCCSIGSRCQAASIDVKGGG